jgi:lantibiotic biosynthesis protein
LLLSGPEGAYAAEFVVPFLRTRAAPSAAEQLGLRHASESLSVRRRPPGSDWLYAKIYAPRGLHPRIVCTLRAEVVVPCRESAIRDWFYLPYADPEPHVRVRFRGPRHRLRNGVLSRLERALEPLVQSGTVWRWELSTYERELERYGGSQHVELAEQVFHADSEATCSLLELCGGDSELRWQLALVGIDRLLRDAGLDLAARLALARTAADAYAAEFGADVEALRAMGEQYKSHSARLGTLLWPRARADAHADRADEIFSARSRRLGSVWTEYGRLSETGALERQLPELALTFSHLHALRMLGVNARRHEFVLYQFLRRQYAAQQARLAARLGGH